MKNNTLIPAILKKRRDDLGYSAQFVVDELKKRGIILATQTLYGYENGVSTPNVNTFLCLCDLYKINDIMDEFGYKYKLATGDDDWQTDLYNDFFNAPLLDKLYLLLQHGVPSFSGYEKQLRMAFPEDADRANFNKLYSVFCALNESGQKQLLTFAEYLAGKEELLAAPLSSKTKKSGGPKDQAAATEDIISSSQLLPDGKALDAALSVQELSTTPSEEKVVQV